MTVKLMHPESRQEIEVADSAVPRYLSQGWREPAVDAPKGNASTDEWREYALSKGFTEADLEGKTRAELRAALA